VRPAPVHDRLFGGPEDFSDMRFLVTATHTLALLISRIFFPRNERTVVFFVVSFFPPEKTIHLRRRDGRRSPRARDERHVSADGIHAMSFVSFATTT
jgi:transcriptional regulator of nitric oxide reductase